MTGQKFNGINCLTCFRENWCFQLDHNALFHCEFSTNLLNWLTWIFLSSCSSGTRPVFSTLQTGVCWCTAPVCAIFRPVTSIQASWWSHSMGLRTEYIFITKYITMAIKTSNTRLIIPVIMITIVALHFFTFTVGCSGMLHYLCFVSNRNLKIFSSKQYDKACKTPLTVPRTLPVTSALRECCSAVRVQRHG